MNVQLHEIFLFRQLWETLDANEAKLICRIMGLKKARKEYLQQLASKESLVAGKKDQIQAEIDAMMHRVNELKVRARFFTQTV